MTCKCLDDNGSYASRCTGKCVMTTGFLNPAAQTNFREDTDVRLDKLEHRMNTFLDSLRIQINEMKAVNLQSWKDGFISGIREAIDGDFNRD